MNWVKRSVFSVAMGGIALVVQGCTSNQSPALPSLSTEAPQKAKEGLLTAKSSPTIMGTGSRKDPYLKSEIDSGKVKPTKRPFWVRLDGLRPIEFEGKRNSHLANAGWHGPMVEARIDWKLEASNKLVLKYEAFADNPLYREGGPRGPEGVPRSASGSNTVPLWEPNFPTRFKLKLETTASSGRASSGERDLNLQKIDIKPEQAATSALAVCKFDVGVNDHGERNEFVINFSEILVRVD